MAVETKINDLIAQGKKKEGFKVLADEYSIMLYSHIYKMTANHADAQDILQNTFYKAWKHLDKFQAKSKFSTWLYRIASNESYTYLQKRKVNLTVRIPTESKQYSDDLHADPELVLAKALDILPPKQKQVFIMRYYDELKYSAISEILGTSEGALKASYHLAVSKIEKFIKQD